MVAMMEEVPDDLAADDVSVEVIDLRTLVPFDKETVVKSVCKTGRLVIVHEAVRRGGMGAEIAAAVMDSGFWILAGSHSARGESRCTRSPQSSAAEVGLPGQRGSHCGYPPGITGGVRKRDMATPLKMPRLSKGMTAGEVVEWLKSPGELVQAGEPLLIVLSEKADVEVEAPAAGVLLKTLASPGEEVPVGAVLAWIGQPGETLDTADPGGAPPAATTSVPGAVEAKSRLPQSAGNEPQARLAPSGKVKAAPAARRLASEAGIALTEISGSGLGGLITESDVKQAIQKATTLPVGRPKEPPREKRRMSSACRCEAFGGSWPSAWP